MSQKNIVLVDILSTVLHIHTQLISSYDLYYTWYIRKKYIYDKKEFYFVTTKR